MTSDARRSGQAAAEYVAAAAVLLAVAAALFGLARAVQAHGERTAELVSSPFP